MQRRCIVVRIAKSLEIDIRAVADLDAIFTSDVQKTIDRSPALQARYREELFAEPPVTHVALRPLIEAANQAGAGKDERSRARWLADLNLKESGLISRRNKLIEVWRAEGLWLHPQGTLEDVLGIEKGRAQPDIAASTPGAIDIVSNWCAFELDPRGELEHLLGAAVERIANNINQAQGVDPAATFDRPVGTTASIDERLAGIEHLPNGKYRLTVKLPIQFAGYWLDFDRDTPPSGMHLSCPPAPQIDEEGPAATSSLELVTSEDG
jgi:hypothetical protein